MSKTQSIGSVFGNIAAALGNAKAPIAAKKARPEHHTDYFADFAAAVGAEPLVRKTRVSKTASEQEATPRQRNREMRKFARGLKAMGVRRLRFMPFVGSDDLNGGVAFRSPGKAEDRLVELKALYSAEGSLKSVKQNDEIGAIVMKLSYSRTSRVELHNKGVVFYP